MRLIRRRRFAVKELRLFLHLAHYCQNQILNHQDKTSSAVNLLLGLSYPIWRAFITPRPNWLNSNDLNKTVWFDWNIMNVLFIRWSHNMWIPNCGSNNIVSKSQSQVLVHAISLTMPHSQCSMDCKESNMRMRVKGE